MPAPGSDSPSGQSRNRTLVEGRHECKPGSIPTASLILVSALVEVHDLKRPSDLDVTIDVQ